MHNQFNAILLSLPSDCRSLLVKALDMAEAEVPKTALNGLVSPPAPGLCTFSPLSPSLHIAVRDTEFLLTGQSCSQCNLKCCLHGNIQLDILTYIPSRHFKILFPQPSTRTRALPLPLSIPHVIVKFKSNFKKPRSPEIFSP